jgi:hypothetical protein
MRIKEDLQKGIANKFLYHNKIFFDDKLFI